MLLIIFKSVYSVYLHFMSPNAIINLVILCVLNIAKFISHFYRQRSSRIVYVDACIMADVETKSTCPMLVICVIFIGEDLMNMGI